MRIRVSLYLTATTLLLSCAPTQNTPAPASSYEALPAADNTDKKNDRSPPTKTIPAQTMPLPLKDTTRSAKQYWVKRPGISVYNQDAQIIGSLRLRPQVTVFETRGEWGKIDSHEDKWVKLSELSDVKPDGLLLKPEDDNGLPNVSLEKPEAKPGK